MIPKTCFLLHAELPDGEQSWLVSLTVGQSIMSNWPLEEAQYHQLC